MQSSVVAPSGPVDLSQVWIGDRIIAHDVHGDDLADVLQQNGDASAWAIAPRTDSTDLRRLARMLGLDDLVVTELLRPGHRVRFAELDSIRLVRLRAVSLQGRQISGSDVSLIIADQILIVLADDQYGSELARTLSAASKRLTNGTAEQAARHVIDYVISGMAHIAEELEAASDALAEQLFGGEPLSRQSKLDAFRLRRAVTELRRVTDPTREALQDLLDTDSAMTEVDTRRWNLVLDHASRVAGTVSVLGDSLTTIFDTSLALDNARMSDVMKKLTGWAGIIAVPTLVTGFVGMNVSFWLSDTRLGFYVYLVLMVLVAVILYVVFRRKSWI
ncbi:MAG TPA: CorA family divalent cation transporter [Microlunatus sp.]